MLPRLVLATTALSVVLLAALSASAEPAVAWDQAKVSELASELATATKELDRAMRSGSTGERDTSRRDFYRLKETVRRIRDESSRLAALLEKGGGHDETLPVVEQLGVQVRDAREVLKRMFTTKSLMDRITPIRAVLDELAPYYDAKPLPPPLGAR